MLLLRSYITALVLVFGNTLAARDPHDQTITVWNWPLTATAPTELASITYNALTLEHSVSKYTPLPLEYPSDEIIRVGLYDPKAEPSWRGVAISPETVSDRFQQLLTLHLDSSGKVHHVGLSAEQYAAKKPSQRQLKVELVSPVAGPLPPLNKPVVVSPSGKVEGQVEEKSFIQKYWWLFGLFLLFQMLMAGGKEEK